MMRKMQVPAYWPVVEGVHLAEKSEVLVEVKRVPIFVDFKADEDISILQTANQWRGA